ncbi:hypothetical protein SIN8267_00874 [Sinobacterium norvegicum]|uniref:Type II secretion system protein N n=1 Tax=Sinobacterium norvegicum TaxID=1641715 RepID=A0ABN8EGF1_9GAMM|nr:type II secretion system protein N [Sinobacterium norvegicum]CAH0990775.1 hypothetical protein SIN8267_00874 [Sinobacterium norvegicum]
MLNPMAFLQRRKMLLIILSLVFFVILLLAKTPAQLLVNIVQSAGVPVFASGVKGTVWQGRAEQLAIPLQRDQYWQLGEVEWQLSAWSLLLAKANLHVHSRYQQQSASIVLSVSPSTVVVSSADIRAPAAIVTQFLPLLPNITGALRLTIDEAVIDINQPLIESLTGELHIGSLSVAQDILVYLGDYRLDVEIQQNALTAQLKDSNATVGIKGKATAALGGGDYTVDVTIIPTIRTEQSVLNLLQLVAVQQHNGSFELQQKGRM